MSLPGIELKGSIKTGLLLRPVPENVPFSAIHDPFLTIPSPDPLATCLLGEMHTDSGQSLGLVTVWFQREDAPGDGHGQDLLAAESIWIRESTLMAQMGRLSPGFITLAPYASASGMPKKQPPAFYCKKNRVLFHPLCPLCGGKLTECRDDEALLKSGLKEFVKAEKRYLWCPECAQKETGGPAFYTRMLDPADRGNPRVADLAGMLRLWAGLINPADQEENGLPCIRCAHRQSCFTMDEAGIMEAQSVITPLSFFDYFLRITAFYPMDIGLASDIIAGRPVREILEMARHARNPVAEKQLRETAFSIAESIPGEPDPAVVLCMKTGLWARAVSQVRALWERDPAPLMSLSPLSFGVAALEALPAQGSELPIKTRLLIYSRATNTAGDTDSARPLETTDPLYLPAEVSSGRARTRMAFLVDSCIPAQAAGTHIIEGMLNIRDLPSGLEWKNCRFSISLGPSQGLSRETRILFTVSGTSGRELKLQSVPTPLTERDASVLQMLTSQPAFPVSCTLLPANPASADLYSLGILGARILLTDQEQDMPEICRALGRLREHIFEAASTDSNPKDITKEAVAEYEELSMDHLLWQPEADLPGLEDQWHRLIALMLRLISFPADSEQQEDARPVDILRGIEHELLEIMAQAQKQGNGPPMARGPRNPELASLLRDTIKDTGWLTRDETPPKGKDAPETERPAQPSEAPAAKDAGAVELEETVILGRDSISGLDRDTRKPEPEDLSEEDMDKTIVIRPGRHDA